MHGGSWSGTHACNPCPERAGERLWAVGGLHDEASALAFSFALLLAGYADAQTPRKGGTIRMTAPYGTNISTMDMHTTPRAQDDITAR